MIFKASLNQISLSNKNIWRTWSRKHIHQQRIIHFGASYGKYVSRSRDDRNARCFNSKGGFWLLVLIKFTQTFLSGHIIGTQRLDNLSGFHHDLNPKA